MMKTAKEAGKEYTQDYLCCTCPKRNYVHCAEQGYGCSQAIQMTDTFRAGVEWSDLFINVATEKMSLTEPVIVLSNKPMHDSKDVEFGIIDGEINGHLNNSMIMESPITHWRPLIHEQE